MKKIFLGCICLPLIVSVVIILWISMSKETNNRPQANGVAIQVVESTLTSTGAKFITTDTNWIEGLGPPFWHNDDYIIEKKVKGKWIELEKLQPVQGLHYEVGLSVGEKGFSVDSIDWSEVYGTLEKGEYRFVKWISWNDEFFYFDAPFTIE